MPPFTFYALCVYASATGKSFKTISPELSSDEENTYPQKPRHHISRSVEDLAGSSRTHTIRRSFK